MVGCLTVGAGILARSQGVSKGTGADRRFVKNVLKNAECHLAYIRNRASHFLSISYNEGYRDEPTIWWEFERVCMLYGIG